MPWDPPDTEERAAARLLRIDVDSDAAAVRTAFRELAKQVHPDRAHHDANLDIGRLVDARDRLLARAQERSRRPLGAERGPNLTVARARRKTPFDDRIIDLTEPLGHLVDVTG